MILSILIYSTSKYQLFTFINHHRSYTADIIFTFFTELGSGYILIPIGIYLLFKKNYKAILSFTIILLMNSLIVSILKHYFYEPRPLLSYGKAVVQTAPWVELYQKYSFPSGHTALSFAIATYVAILFKNSKVQFFAFAIAACIGYSRVYLGEHFPIDVCCGSILGFTVACLYFIIKEWIISLISRKKEIKATIPELSKN
ncbi:phosphatase PAP2 family protein [Rhizosphaericola mali]|nr:phosphatase PAP2 family protein [Rhizosphaericola mali]